MNISERKILITGILVLVLFGIGCFAYTDKPTSPSADQPIIITATPTATTVAAISPPAVTGGTSTVTAYSPEFNENVTIEYSADFASELSEISTVDWPTYKSAFGYQIKYPPDWEVFSCVNGYQVFFYADASVPKACDIPHSADFAIIGPNPRQDEQLLEGPARLQEDFDLNGTDVIRYIDYVSGQSGYDLIEDVRVPKNGAYIDLYIGPASHNIFEERMLTTFQLVGN
jgi:hypothetical protein